MTEIPAVLGYPLYLYCEHYSTNLYDYYSYIGNFRLRTNSLYLCISECSADLFNLWEKLFCVESVLLGFIYLGKHPHCMSFCSKQYILQYYLLPINMRDKTTAGWTDGTVTLEAMYSFRNFVSTISKTCNRMLVLSFANRLQFRTLDPQ